jgi:hypothetical protein
MTSFTDLIRDSPKEANRLSTYALKQNPNMKNFREFEDALKEAFSVDPRGQGALNFINDEESVLLFETKTIQDAIRENAGEDYANAIQDAHNYEVIRKVPKGQPTKKSDIYLIKSPRQIETKSHTREGQSIKSYQKGYRGWANSERAFVQARVEKKLTPKQIINEYNQHFKNNQRTASSIKTKMQRMKVKFD